MLVGGELPILYGEQKRPSADNTACSIVECGKKSGIASSCHRGRNTCHHARAGNVSELAFTLRRLHSRDNPRDGDQQSANDIRACRAKRSEPFSDAPQDIEHHRHRPPTGTDVYRIDAEAVKSEKKVFKEQKIKSFQTGRAREASVYPKCMSVYWCSHPIHSFPKGAAGPRQ